MHEPLRQYDTLLADIKRQLAQIKRDLSPEQALEMCNEVQSHLNRVMADVQELASIKYDYEAEWAGTIYLNQTNG